MYKIPAKTLFVGQKLIYVPECHSTNSALAELLDRTDLPEGTVLITNHQTQGRGQRGNSWESGKGENLTFSLLLRPRFLTALNQFQLNVAIALGIADGLLNYLPSGLTLKWPNDIMMENRKVGGVLIENQTQGQQLSTAIIGIGLNVNQPELSHPGAGSLTQFVGRALDLNEVYQELLAGIEARYLSLRAGNYKGLHKEYVERLYQYNVSQEFESDGMSFIGTISDVDESGRLCVLVDGAIRKYSLKEIRMRISG